MTSFLIPLRPVNLALLIGLTELFLSESVKFSIKFAQRYRRCRLLYGSGSFEFRHSRSILRKAISTSTIVNILQLSLLGLCIWLEKSIDPFLYPSTTRIDGSCYSPLRETRAVQNGGPNTNELLDDSISTYISRSGCKLFSTSLSGPYALTEGYPICISSLTKRRIDEHLVLQGGANAFVANSRAGDPHVSYGIEDLGKTGKVLYEDRGTDWASTSFWALGMGSFNRSNAVWSFKNHTERVISNVALPYALAAGPDQNFSKDATGAIECTTMDEDCYHRFAQTALSLNDSITQTISEGGDSTRGPRGHGKLNASIPEPMAYLIRSHRDPNVPDFICVFDILGEGSDHNSSNETQFGKVTLNIQWVFLDLRVPGAERNRSGPTPTRLHISGWADCAWGIQHNLKAARLYMDSMEYVNLGLAKQLLSHNNGLPMMDHVMSVLNHAAVKRGMQTDRDKATICKVYKVQNGSTVGRVETITSAIFDICLLIVIIVSVLSAINDRSACSSKDDPLATPALLRELEKYQSIETKCSTLASDDMHFHTDNISHYSLSLYGHREILSSEIFKLDEIEKQRISYDIDQIFKSGLSLTGRFTSQAAGNSQDLENENDEPEARRRSVHRHQLWSDSNLRRVTTKGDYDTYMVHLIPTESGHRLRVFRNQ